MGWVADLFKEIPLSVNLQSKLELLEEKFSESEARIKQLESELDEAHKEITRLNKIIEASNEEQAKEKLKEIEEQILKLLFDTNQHFYPSTMASKFNIKIGVIEYHLNNLLELDLIGSQYNTEDETHYYIITNGRAYIVENT